MVHLSGWLRLIILASTMLADTEKETACGSDGQQRPFRCKGWAWVARGRQKQAKEKKEQQHLFCHKSCRRRVCEDFSVSGARPLTQLWPPQITSTAKMSGEVKKKRERGNCLWSVYQPWWWIEMEYPPLCPDPSAHTSPSLSTLLLMQSLGFAAVCPFFDAGPFL